MNFLARFSTLEKCKNEIDAVRSDYRMYMALDKGLSGKGKGLDYMAIGSMISIEFTVLAALAQGLLYFVLPNSWIGTLIFNIVGTWWTILGLYWTSGYLYVCYTFITKGRTALEF